MKKRWVKKYFIPHKGNDHKPHVLRKASVLGLAAFIGFLFIASSAQHYLITSTDLSAVISSTLVDLTNTDRARAEIGTLAVNSTLQEAAELKAQDMAERGYFAHESPDGLDPWHWFNEAGYDFAYAGENLAVDFSDSVDVENAWMNSPQHRANILNERFTEIGIATARGTYNGRKTTFVVQMFGRPSASEAHAAETAQEESDSGPVGASDPAGGEEQTPSSEQESTETNVAGAESGAPSVAGLQTIEEDDMFIAVENTNATASAKNEQHIIYTAWYERALASPHATLKYIYTILSGVILLTLILMVFIEIRRQHLLHITYGVLLLALMLILLYLGREFIFPEVLIV